MTSKVEVSDGETAILELWDTEERMFKSATNSSSATVINAHIDKGTDAVVVLYDITSKDGFESVRTWREQYPCDHHKVSVLVGTKNDLETYRKVTRQQGEALSKELKFDKFVECSAKQGVELSTTFKFIAETLCAAEITGHDHI